MKEGLDTLKKNNKTSKNSEIKLLPFQDRELITEENQGNYLVDYFMRSNI